jgi:protein TonB
MKYQISNYPFFIFIFILVTIVHTIALFWFTQNNIPLLGDMEKGIRGSISLINVEVIERTQDKSNKKSSKTKPQERMQRKTKQQGSNDILSRQGKVKNKYLSNLRSLINQNKYYPLIARKFKHQGTVIMGLTIVKDGSFINTKVIKSSSYHTLDKAALNLLQKIKRFDPLPSFIKTGKLELVIPITYSLI